VELTRACTTDDTVHDEEADTHYGNYFGRDKQAKLICLEIRVGETDPLVVGRVWLRGSMATILLNDNFH
jgi:hypothetical protein